MKISHILLITFIICLGISNSCKKEEPGIEEKDGWYALTSEFSSETLYSVFFIDENKGYIVGTGGLIINTLNSGLNWTKQTSNTTDTIRSVHFVNENTGYTVGSNGIILKTIDGGTNWVKQISGTDQDLSSVFFTSENTGYVIGKSGLILKTTDGGTNWLIQISGTSNDFNSVWFTDTDKGFIVGNNGTILKTADGGNSWELKLQSTNKNLASVCFPENDIGYIVGIKKEYSDDDIILKTLNGGINWTQIKSDNSFRALHFVNANIGFAVSGYRQTTKAAIYKTVDGGTTWTGNTSIVKELYSIYFIDENTGFSVGFDRDSKINILKTKNGGEYLLNP